MIKIEIFKSKNCPHCDPATEIVKRVTKKSKGVEVIETYLESPGGAAKALMFGVESVPTILINEKIAFVGVPEEAKLERAIKKAGEKNEETS